MPGRTQEERSHPRIDPPVLSRDSPHHHHHQNVHRMHQCTFACCGTGASGGCASAAGGERRANSSSERRHPFCSNRRNSLNGLIGEKSSVLFAAKCTTRSTDSTGTAGVRPRTTYSLSFLSGIASLPLCLFLYLLLFYLYFILCIFHLHLSTLNLIRVHALYAMFNISTI